MSCPSMRGKVGGQKEADGGGTSKSDMEALLTRSHLRIIRTFIQVHLHH